MSWWVWLLVGWVVVSLMAGLVIGRSVRIADDRAPRGAGPAQDRASRAAVRPAAQRRRLPVPAIAFPLVLIGVSLEAVGLVVRAAGADDGRLGALSMDAPLSLPRMYIAALLLAAALFAFVGAARASGRRTWWAGVGMVATVLTEVKAGGTVHAQALESIAVADRPIIGAAVSAVLAGVVLTALWATSRDDRRDRRRVLLSFTVYAIAAVGLSAISSTAGQAFGAASAWTNIATFVEEAAEAVGAAGILLAVMVGVTPRLVLPSAWALRRSADAETVDAPGALPTWDPGTHHLRG